MEPLGETAVETQKLCNQEETKNSVLLGRLPTFGHMLTNKQTNKQTKSA